jgi:hypothetical protein
MSVHGTAHLASELISRSPMEASMKFTVPGIVLAALIVASPLAFAENSDYWSTIWQPGASVAKDDATNTSMAKHLKKHTASYKHRHHAKAMSSKAMHSKAQSTGSGSSSAPGASINKDDTTPKSK